MDDIKKYLDYLKYNKNYSDKTILNYELDLIDYFNFLKLEGLDYKEIKYEDLRYLFNHFEKNKLSNKSEIYYFNGNKTLVIGGAYSIDKEERLLCGYHWFKDEQPSDDTKQKVLEVLKQRNNQIDIILTHTCPFKYLPHEMFIAGVNQSKVDQSTEKYFDLIEEKIDYKNWYCGHFHTDKVIDKMIFMFENYRELK